MPDKSGRYTVQERAFIKAFAACGDPIEAARRAGYTQPESRGGPLLAKPALGREARAALVARMDKQGGVVDLAVAALEELIPDKTLSPSVRIKAIGVALQARIRLFSGDQDAGAKDLHEMSSAEIAAALDQTRRWLEGSAKDVTPAPEPARPPSIFE